MVCRHPVIIDGRCTGCGAEIKPESAASKPAEAKDSKTPAPAPEQPGNGQ